MNENLTGMQKKLILMLKWFHEFCIKYKLHYYALGGTMLGAVRHKGFIPWDDDIDVGMPRKDYRRFIDLCQTEDTGRYIVESLNTKKEDYFYGFTKIYDSTTTLVERAKTNVKRGVYIDLFPLDGAGNSIEEAHENFDSVYKKWNLLLARTCAFRKGRKWYKNVAIVVARIIPDAIINNKKLMLEVDKNFQKKDFDTSKYICNFVGDSFMRIMPKDYIGVPTLYQFENLEIYGVEDYDSYLTNCYGDWHKLPPKENRVSHHDYIKLNLNKSYLDE